MLPLFTAEEVLFNKIEANAYLNNTNECIADLNLFVSKRVSNYDPSSHTVTAVRMRNFFNVTSTRSAIVNTVLAFKRVEFVQEGMRWFDLQRYAIPVEHETFSGQVISVAGNDPRRILQIPQSATLAGLEQNSR
ncbi:RagB/SusD family nutrient uptake outer membrane protein [Dyadobacter sp.]|uniref:RagB/SusD family nutrient uptake outer membrane protein n=1 Tax=Dyadobacter sp. TaxID=1914288 RepID=UPI003F6FA18B